MTFINCSNHPSNGWGERQLAEAEKYGNIVDILFPAVIPESSEKEVENVSEELFQKIVAYNPDAVMCEGEFTLTFSTVTKLKSEGIKVLAACTKRETTEEKMPDGSARKASVFRFVRFREYI